MRTVLTASTRRKKRRKAFNRANGQCEYCGSLLLLPLGTLDHRLPVSRGGTWRDENMAWCCVECNRRKSAAPDDFFLTMMAVQRHRDDSTSRYARKQYRPLTDLINQARMLATGACQP